MQAMAKMANMAKNWERVGGIKEFPLRVAILAKKFLDKKFLVFSLIRWQRGSLKVAIFTEIASLAKMAYSWQNLANIPMTWQRVHFESAQVPPKIEYLAKMVNIRQISKISNSMTKGSF